MDVRINWWTRTQIIDIMNKIQFQHPHPNRHIPQYRRTGTVNKWSYRSSENLVIVGRENRPHTIISATGCFHSLPANGRIMLGLATFSIYSDVGGLWCYFTPDLMSDINVCVFCVAVAGWIRCSQISMKGCRKHTSAGQAMTKCEARCKSMSFCPVFQIIYFE